MPDVSPRRMSVPPDPDSEEPGDRRSAGLIGIIVILVLAILAVVLVREMGRQSTVQDCVMSGRTNCAPIEAPPR
jgi:hypothetical protein